MGHRRSSSRGGCKKGGCKKGKITRNPFFNFLRRFRSKHCNWTITKIAVEGARIWCKMAECEKDKYRKEACGAPKMKRKRRGKSCGSKKSKGRHGRRRRR